MRGGEAGADVFRAVADPTRRALLELLRESDRSFGEMAESFAMTAPAVSQHLRVLREAGLVRQRREGRRHYYRLDPAPLRGLYEWAARYRAVADPYGHVWGLAGAASRNPDR